MNTVQLVPYDFLTLPSALHLLSPQKLLCILENVKRVIPVIVTHQPPLLLY